MYYNLGSILVGFFTNYVFYCLLVRILECNAIFFNACAIQNSLHYIDGALKGQQWPRLAPIFILYLYYITIN